MDKGKLFFWVWQLGSIPTLIYLMFFNANYNWWNWIIMIPINFFLAEIWPIYWLLRWMGLGS
jgi:hypothetical protein